MLVYYSNSEYVEYIDPGDEDAEEVMQGEVVGEAYQYDPEDADRINDLKDSEAFLVRENGELKVEIGDGVEAYLERKLYEEMEDDFTLDVQFSNVGFSLGNYELEIEYGIDDIKEVVASLEGKFERLDLLKFKWIYPLFTGLQKIWYIQAILSTEVTPKEKLLQFDVNSSLLSKDIVAFLVPAILKSVGHVRNCVYTVIDDKGKVLEEPQPLNAKAARGMKDLVTGETHKIQWGDSEFYFSFGLMRWDGLEVTFSKKLYKVLERATHSVDFKPIALAAHN